jgi:adenylosuccinate synthase
MPVTVIVGGQYGSEGKGKTAHYMAREQDASVAIRVGGSNSGHTVISDRGEEFKFQHLPTAAILPDVVCVIAAGSYIDLDILEEEIDRVGLSPERVMIDPNAMIITEADKEAEREARLQESVGSTLSGTGAAVARRVRRERPRYLAKDEECLEDFVRPVKPFLRKQLDQGERILLEGTQGFGLSNLHTPDYPYATSRDTTAAGFVSEAGLSPLDVDDVVLVLRAFPIRVAGNSGPLPNEISWSEVTNASGYPRPIKEFTTVTGRKRRVARFDGSIVHEAIISNNPSKIVVNHVDYIDYDTRKESKLTDRARSFLNKVEGNIGQEVTHWGYSPSAIEEFTLLKEMKV